MSERIIFHIDVNSAFLSWEAVARVRDQKPDIRLIPAAIGGDPAKRTSVILAKSIPAKKYGVTTGEPVTMALRKCPGLQIFPPNFEIYRRNSKAFMDICQKYSPTLQKFSIDECFLDMTGMERIYSDTVAVAYTIKDEIRDTLGFTVNIGVGSNKLLAKMASDFEKPDRVHTLFTQEIPEKMWPLSVRDLLFVGKTSADLLEKAQIMTIGQLANSNLSDIQKLLGDKGGKQAWEYANGRDDSLVSDEKEDAKGYSISTTLEENVKDYAQAEIIFMELAEKLARRMRADKAKAYCVGVTIRLSKIADVNGNTPSTRFANKSHQKKIERATDVTNEIYHIAMELFKELWHGEELRLLKIALSDITRDDYEQLSFFVDEKHEKERKLDVAMDKIKDKFGNDAIVRASSVKNPRKTY